MSLSAQISLSAPVKEVARFLVGKIPQKDLESYAAVSSMFASGGFRKGNVAAVRSRIIQKIEGSELIDASLRRLLAEHDEGCAVISKLATNLVKGNVRAFEFFFGFAQFQFSALLDTRFDEVRFTACPENGAYPEITESDRAWAVSTLSDLLWPLSLPSSLPTSLPLGGAGSPRPLPSSSSLPLGGAGSPHSLPSSLPLGGAGSPRPLPPPSSFAAQKHLRELQAEVSRLKGVETRLEKEQKARAAAETAAAKDLARAEAAEKDEGAWRQRAERAEAELARNKRDAETQAAAVIETRLAEEFASWLGPARAARFQEAAALCTLQAHGADAASHGAVAASLGADAASPGAGALLSGCGAQSRGAGALFSGSGAVAPRAPRVPPASLPAVGAQPPTALLARAASALTAQARADSAAGVRHLLEARLEACEASRARCRAMIVDALDPLPELVEVEKDLAAEIERLRKLLGREPSPAVDPEEALALAINSASDAHLPDLLHTARKLNGLKVLSDEATARLEEAVRRRYSVRYAKRGGPGLENGDANSPDYILRCALQGQVPAILFIDAHNVLYALQARYSRPQDHRGPCAEAREWLVGDIVQMVSNAPTCRVILVFDGPERTESTPSGNVRVIYSGGAKDQEHRADDVIIDEARFLVGAGSSCRLLLVTNDTGLANRGIALGVRNLSPLELLNYLR